jgi:hypothetical protein
LQEGLAAADVHKNLGNQHYQKGENALAIDAYTLAIDKAPPNEKRAAVYFANRAACYMKMVWAAKPPAAVRTVHRRR